MGAKLFGAAVKRLEDPDLLTGKGQFTDDIRVEGALHAVFIRSPHPQVAWLRRPLHKSRALRNTTVPL